MNRGIGKRPLFEDRDDVRYFISRLAREVRAGRIELHAFCVLTTHFHLLIRSPVGEMSEALRCAQNAHSRRFNRRHQRDGTLVRGRFFSKRVEDERYRRAVVRYIDRNPVSARIVLRAREYEFGSARWYAQLAGPVWLARQWVEAETCRLTEQGAFTPELYGEAFPRARAALCDLVERRITSRGSHDPMAELIGAGAPEVRAWMVRKARGADGHAVGLPVCGFEALRDALDQDERRAGRWIVQDGEKLMAGRRVAGAGLAHDLAGMTWGEIRRRTELSETQLRRLRDLHLGLLQRSEDYAERVSRVGQEAIAASLGVPVEVLAGG